MRSDFFMGARVFCEGLGYFAGKDSIERNKEDLGPVLVFF